MYESVRYCPDRDFDLVIKYMIYLTLLVLHRVCFSSVCLYVLVCQKLTVFKTVFDNYLCVSGFVFQGLDVK